MRKSLYVILALLVIFPLISSAQEAGSEKISWSPERKLQSSDFQIKKAESNQSSSYAEFSITYKVGGLDLLSSNLNKRVTNEFIRSGSWIDTTQHVQEALRYQQTSFDLCEVYVRQFRKALLENRKKIKRLSFVDELNEIYTTAYSKRRMEYDLDTKAGTDNEAQLKWEAQIRQELDQLSAYAFEK